MHVYVPPPSVDEYQLPQIEALLKHNLAINTRAIDATRNTITKLESQLATPAAQGGRSKKNLRNARAKLYKALQKAQGEAEILTHALDETQSKIALADYAKSMQNTPIYAPPSQSGFMPLAYVATDRGTSNSSSGRSSSVSSFVGSTDSPYALPGDFLISPSNTSTFPRPDQLYMQPNYLLTISTAGHMMSPVALGISTHNLPSAPLYPISPYMAFSPHQPGTAQGMYYHTPMTALPATMQYSVPWSPYQQMPEQYPVSSLPVEQWTNMSVGTECDAHATVATPPPTAIPAGVDTWAFQQSPVKESFASAEEVKIGQPAPTQMRRRYSMNEAAFRSDGVSRRLRRWFSANLEFLVKEWDEVT